MRICDLLEQLVVDNLIHKLSDKQKNQIIKSYSQHEWIKITEIFLNGVGNEHQVPGRVVYQLWDMCNQVKHKELNREQMWLLLHNLLENWNQMSCESRANLML